MDEVTIMVIDDTPADIALLENVLRTKGYRFLAFTRADLALKAVPEQRPHLILLDLNMPVMDGFETCRRLKGDAATRDIPVIFLSAHDATQKKVEALELGAIDFITKPFQLEEVEVRIENYVRLHQLQQELNTRYEELKRMEELKDNLTHMVVHDLRSPMQAILGLTELMLLRPEGLSESHHRSLQQMLKTSTELNTMVSTLLDVTHLEEQRVPLMPLEQSIQDIIGETIDDLSGLMMDRPVRLEFPDELVQITCDVSMIRRVIENLVANALRLTPLDKEIVIRFFEADARIHVEVLDQGPGIPEEHQKKIFEKFGVLGARNDRRKSNTGLGLAFAKLAVEAHGGNIGVTNRPGEGCTFWFTLPLVAAVSAGAPEPSTPDLLESMPARIILVDDDELTRQILSNYLEEAGYEVTQVQNGKKALECLRQEVPDLLITDLVMPEMEGTELLMQLQKDYPDLPTIVISGKVTGVQANYLKIAELLGARLALPKPIDQETLLRAVGNILFARGDSKEEG